MSYAEVMDMPLRGFWNLNKQVQRLRAEEKLEQIDLFVIANQNSDPKMIQRLRDATLTAMGNPVVEDKTFIEKDTHTKGIAKLKELRTRMRKEGG